MFFFQLQLIGICFVSGLCLLLLFWSQLSLNEIKAHGSYKISLSTPEIYSQNHLAAVNEEMSAYTFPSYNKRISSITCRLSKLSSPVSYSYKEAIESEDKKTVCIVKPRFRYQGKKEDLMPRQIIISYVTTMVIKKVLLIKAL